MKDEQDYVKDIVEMRSMMERSSKYLSVSGLASIFAGVYALCGASIAFKYFYFNPDQIFYGGNPASGNLYAEMRNVVVLAIVVLLLSVGTAIFLSYRKANSRGERVWSSSSRRLLVNMAVPLVTGGALILVMMAKGMIGLIAPFTLLFYGLALYSASKFTYEEVRSLGLIQITLGLLGSYFVGYGTLLWALGFGVVHIIYGIYLYYRYER